MFNYHCSLSGSFTFYIFFRFGSDDLQKLCNVVQLAVSAPVHGEASPFILPSLNDPVLTPLQEGVLLCMDTLQRVCHITAISKLLEMSIHNVFRAFLAPTDLLFY